MIFFDGLVIDFKPLILTNDLLLLGWVALWHS